MLQFTCRRLHFPVTAGDRPRGRPVITRSRSWRGMMQVRYDDTRADRNQFLKHAFIWGPMRVAGLGLTISMFLYFYMGHDQYMFQMFGYESEAYIEHKRMQEPTHLLGDLLMNDRRAFKNIRHNEPPVHDKITFPLFKEGIAQRAVGEPAKGMPSVQRYTGSPNEAV